MLRHCENVDPQKHFGHGDLHRYPGLKSRYQIFQEIVAPSMGNKHIGLLEHFWMQIRVWALDLSSGWFNDLFLNFFCGEPIKLVFML